MERVVSAAPGRRQEAPHPGPLIARDYLAPLRLDASSLAAAVGMDGPRLQSMLDGTLGIDVETAVRLSRSLQLNPKRVMELQLRHDFARARDDAALETIPVLRNDGRVTFPADGYLQGRLAGLRATSGYGEVRFDTLGFFQDEAQGGDIRTRMHAIRPGVRLRIYGADELPVWQGIVLASLDGKPLLPYARPNTWIEWFVKRLRADFVGAV